MSAYWVVKAKQSDGKWVNWAGVTADTKAEALAKASADIGFPVRVVCGSPAQDRKFARQARDAGFAPVSGKAATSTVLTQAFTDWLAGRAYWCQVGGYGSTRGYYRIKGGRAATWNKAVKEQFATCSEFHLAAHNQAQIAKNQASGIK